MNQELLKAFHRLEQREKARNKRRQREEEEAKFRAERLTRLADEQKQRRRFELAALSFTLLFAIAISIIVWLNFDAVSATTAVLVGPKKPSPSGVDGQADGKDTGRKASGSEEQPEGARMSIRPDSAKPFTLYHKRKEKKAEAN